MILWLKRYRKQKIRNIILYFVVLSIFVWEIGYDLDSQMHPEGRSMTVRFAFYVQKWPIHKEKLTPRKTLQMAAEKRFLKGVYMSIRVLFICHGRIRTFVWKTWKSRICGMRKGICTPVVPLYLKIINRTTLDKKKSKDSTYFNRIRIRWVFLFCYLFEYFKIILKNSI